MKRTKRALATILCLLLCISILMPNVHAATAMPFTDVKASDWFYSDVKFCYEKGLMNGVGNNKFAPNNATTRAMIVTALYRAAGSPSVKIKHPFTDVAKGSWYEAPIAWAYQNGIVNGVTTTKFSPDGSLSRQQLVTILYRYAQHKKIPTVCGGDLSVFSDSNTIASYAKDAFAWAYGENIITGSNGKLSPNSASTRAQFAAFIHRFMEWEQRVAERAQKNLRISYNRGSCKELSGNIQVVVFFIDDAESNWTAKEIQNALTSGVNSALNYLSRNAAQWGIDLSFSVDYYATGDSKGTSLMYDGLFGNVMYGTDSPLLWAGDQIDEVAEDLGFDFPISMLTSMQRQYNNNEIIYLCMANKKGRSCALGTSDVDHVQLFGAYSGTIAHEILHLYGAEDYYYDSGKGNARASRSQLVRTLYGTEIMLDCTIWSALTELTAYSIGWIDEPPAAYFSDGWWN